MTLRVLVDAGRSPTCLSQRPLVATLTAFLGASVRPPTPLVRAIMTVLIAKFVAVTAMLFNFYFSSQHVAADAAAIGRVLGPAALP